MSDRKRYALVGTGGRAGMFVQAILDTYHDSSDLVGLCDLSQVRMDWYNQKIQEYGVSPRPTYLAADFDRMIAETKPDTVIVTTMDCTHHLYINRAMELGCDVITEKPMTTDDEKAHSIFDTIARTGKSLRVTFNYRYAPAATKFREFAGWIKSPGGPRYPARIEKIDLETEELVDEFPLEPFATVIYDIVGIPPELADRFQLEQMGSE